MAFLSLNTGYFMQGELCKPINISKHKYLGWLSRVGGKNTQNFLLTHLPHLSVNGKQALNHN